MRRTLLTFALLLSLPACAIFGFGTTSAHHNDDARAKLEQLRADAQSGSASAQIAYASALYYVMIDPNLKAEIGALDWDVMLAEADAMLEQHAADPDEAVAFEAVAVRGHLQVASGRKAEALATWEAFHAARPSYAAAMAVMEMARTTGLALAEPVEFCAQNRSLVGDDSELHQYMAWCYQLNLAAGSMAAALPWATEDDIATYNRVEAQRTEENNARIAAQEAEREAAAQRRSEEAAAASSSSSSSSSSPAGPSVVYITLKNNCRQTVKLFFGAKPKFGSGTYSSIGSNTQTSHSLKPGDMIWIVDDSQNGISSTSVSASTSRVEITESCTGLTAR